MKRIVVSEKGGNDNNSDELKHATAEGKNKIKNPISHLFIVVACYSAFVSTGFYWLTCLVRAMVSITLSKTTVVFFVFWDFPPAAALLAFVLRCCFCFLVFVWVARLYQAVWFGVDGEILLTKRESYLLGLFCFYFFLSLWLRSCERSGETSLVPLTVSKELIITSSIRPQFVPFL